MARTTLIPGFSSLDPGVLQSGLRPILRWALTILGWALTSGLLLFLGSLRSDQPDARSPLLYPLCEITHAAENSGRDLPSPYIGIWIAKQDLARLPMQGPAWNALVTAANKNPGKPDIQDQNENNDVYVLAKALVYARTGDLKYRAEVISNLMQAVGTEKGGRTLALGRNLTPYVIAADLVNLPQNPSEDRVFRTWLRGLLSEKLGDGRTLPETQEKRPNNWGTHAGAARAAIALYLGDNAELDRAARVFQGYLGDQSAYRGFRFGTDLSWQCDPANPVPVNPSGCVKDGHSLDGALPEEMRRGATLRWPPVQTGYAWEGLQGAIVTANILSRAGYPAWDWQDRALLRAVRFLYSIGWTPQKDDAWQIWLINHAYGTDFPTVSPAPPGKNMGWTDWSHAQPTQPDPDIASKVLRCK